MFTRSADNRSHTVGFTDIAELCAGAGLPLHAVSQGTLADENAAIRRLAPHYILVIGWSRLVSPETLGIPRSLWATSEQGTDGQGSSAQSSSGQGPTTLGTTAASGCTEPAPDRQGAGAVAVNQYSRPHDTALSTFILEDSADSGAIIGQLPLKVRPAETATTLFLRMADLHYHAGLLLAPQLAARAVAGTAQDDSAATVWAKRRPADSELSLPQAYDQADRSSGRCAGPTRRHS